MGIACPYIKEQPTIAYVFFQSTSSRFLLCLKPSEFVGVSYWFINEPPLV